MWELRRDPISDRRILGAVLSEPFPAEGANPNTYPLAPGPYFNQALVSGNDPSIHHTWNPHPEALRHLIGDQLLTINDVTFMFINLSERSLRRSSMTICF